MRPGALCPQAIIWAHKIIYYALLLVHVTGYRILGALSTFKVIALCDSVVSNVSAVVDNSCCALAVATHPATGAVGTCQVLGNRARDCCNQLQSLTHT